MLALILLSVSLFLLCYTYILYPLILNILSSIYSIKIGNPSSIDHTYEVFILMAAHNEESVILDKLRSINKSDYPAEKVKIYIGSDNSIDGTNDLIKSYIDKCKYPIFFHVMEKRSGKVGTINQLYRSILKANTLNDKSIFICTDANVIFHEKTITNLVRNFSDSNIGIVDTQIQNLAQNEHGVFESESTYLNREVKLKYQEGKLFGNLMGAFGGCFAIRATCFQIIPENLRVDDFFLSMQTMIKGYKIISEPKAICYEKVGLTFNEEFKRKRRISSGNFQNLAHFKKHILPINKLGIIFFSHKVIRYIGPLLMLLTFISSIYLAIYGEHFFTLLLMAQGIWYAGIPLIDILFQKFGINIVALRNVRYFNYMNLALLLGFKDYINGIESNIWEPTKRA